MGCWFSQVKEWSLGNLPDRALASVFNFSTSVFPSGNFTPVERCGGSATFSVFRRGVTSTPRSAGLSVSIGFFLAFMMFGNAIPDVARRDYPGLAPERPALRDAAEHPEGQQKADGNAQARGPGVRRSAAADDP